MGWVLDEAPTQSGQWVPETETKGWVLEEPKANLTDLAEYAGRKGLVELPYKIGEFAAKTSPPDVAATTINSFLKQIGSDVELPTISGFLKKQAEDYAPTQEQAQAVNETYPIAAPVAEMVASAPAAALLTAATGGTGLPTATGASIGSLFGAVESQDKPIPEQLKSIAQNALLGGVMGKASDIAGLELKPADREAVNVFKNLNKEIKVGEREIKVGNKVKTEDVMAKVGDVLMSQEVEGAPVLGKDLSLLKEAGVYNTSDDFINAIRKTDPNEIRSNERLSELWSEAHGEARTELPNILTAQKDPLMSLVDQKNIAETALKDSEYNVNSPIFKDESKKLFQQIADYVRESPDIQTWVEKFGITPDEFATQFEKAKSDAGRSLNQLSQVRKALDALPDDHPLKLAANVASPPSTAWDYLKDAWNFFDRARLGSMVTQLATTVRNVWSQGGRYAINVFDDALQGTFKLVGGAKPYEAYASLMNDISAIGRFVGSKHTNWVNDIDSILGKFPKEKNLLFSTPVSDVLLGGGKTSFLQKATNVRDKALNTLNALNKGQEYFFRRLVFDGKIRALAQEKGIPLSAVTQEMAQSAVGDALEMTFATRPRKGFGNALLETYRQLPFLTVIHPYPRFWLNAMKFMYDFSPAGIVAPAIKSLVGKEAPGELMKALSKASIGAGMFGIAMGLRSDPNLRGEKWYEVKVGDKYIDTRAYSPFSTYMFISELFQHPELLKDNKVDLAEGILSISRIGATGFAILDVAKGNVDNLKEVIGSYLGGYTVPFRTLKDVISYFDGSEELSRNTKSSPIIGPAMENIPWVSRAAGFKPSINILTGEPYRRHFALERQVTGVTSKTKDKVQKEADRLGLSRLEPRTGEPELDNAIKGRVGWFVNDVLSNLEDSPQYKLLSDDSKARLTRKAISDIKTYGAKMEAVPFYVNKLDGLDDKYDYLENLVKKNKLDKKGQLSLISYSLMKNYITKAQAYDLGVIASYTFAPSFESQ